MSVEEEALALHRESIVIDALTVVKLNKEYARNAKAGGLTAASYTMHTSGDPLPYPTETYITYTSVDAGEVNFGLVESLRLIHDNTYLFNEVYKDTFSGPTTSAKQIEQCKEEGKIAWIMEFQNSTSIEGALWLLPIFYKLGLRVMQLTYNQQNLIGHGAYERVDAGLSEFGVKVVEKMNELGMLIDASHCGDKTTLDAIEISKDPIALTHCCCRALYDHRRNKTDEIMKALTEKGGVMGINAFPIFVDSKVTTIENWANHIDHAVNVMGVDHVGIGLDLNDGLTIKDMPPQYIHYAPKWVIEGALDKSPPANYPKGIEHVQDLPNITKELVRRGNYTKEEIKKILGENFLRLYRKVWRA